MTRPNGLNGREAASRVRLPFLWTNHDVAISQAWPRLLPVGYHGIMTMPSVLQAAPLLAGLCLAATCAAKPPAAEALDRACEAVALDDRIELPPLERRHVSACPPGDDEGCPYSGLQGKTSLSDTPDLDKDGPKDAILTYVGSSNGDIDVTDKLVLAQCRDGTCIRLLEGKFTTLTAPAMPHATWPVLEATRNCPQGCGDAVRTEKIQLNFDPSTATYRGPAGLDLAVACRAQDE